MVIRRGGFQPPPFSYVIIPQPEGRGVLPLPRLGGIRGFKSQSATSGERCVRGRASSASESPRPVKRDSVKLRMKGA